MGLYKDSFISKAKVACRSKAKQGIPSPLPMDRQEFIHPQESGITKHHRSKSSPLSFFFPQHYTLSTMLYGLGYPLGQLCTPCLLTAGAV